MHLGPRQMKLACVQVMETPPYTVKLELLSLKLELRPGTNLAKAHYDFVEELWAGEESHLLFGFDGSLSLDLEM